MATEMITVKMDEAFLDDIDAVVKKEKYQNRTEFIRNALREKINEIKVREAMVELSHLKGASKKKISEEEYENARKNAFEIISKKLR